MKKGLILKLFLLAQLLISSVIFPIQAIGWERGFEHGKSVMAQYIGYNNPKTALYEGQYDYLIITNEALKKEFQVLAETRNAQDIKTKIECVENIYSKYGGRDHQEQIRNCIIDYYVNAGVDYVLLGGDGDNNNPEENIIPARELICTVEYKDSDNKVQTITDNIPADCYYAGLHGNWDKNGNNIFGEWDDGGDSILEVAIGRAPVDTPLEARNFIRKTLKQNIPILYSPSQEVYKALLVGEYLSENYTYKYGGDELDLIKYGEGRWKGFASDPEFKVKTLYERDTEPDWSAINLTNEINEGIHILVHDGHANFNSNMKLSSSSMGSLRTLQTFFGYSLGCDSGAFDNQATDEEDYNEDDCIIENFLTSPFGPFAYIANSRWGIGPIDLIFMQAFFNAYFRDGIKEIGQIFKEAKERAFWANFDDWFGLKSDLRWCFYGLNLFGDPTATLVPPKGKYEVSIKVNAPDYPSICNKYKISATVNNVGWEDVPYVDLYLKINDIIVASDSIVNLPLGGSSTIEFNWEPYNYGTYEISAFANTHYKELWLKDNEDSKIIEVAYWAKRIGFIRSHGEYLDGSSRLKDFYENLGYTVEDIDTQITFEMLRDFCYIFLGEKGNTWEESEVDALINFAERPSRTVVGIGNFPCDGTLQLAARYGIEWEQEDSGDWDEGATENFDPHHPVMRYVESIYLPFNYYPLIVSGPAKPILWDHTGKYCYGATVETYSGHILILGQLLDKGIDSEWGCDNDDLFENLLDWRSIDISVSLEAPDSPVINEPNEIIVNIENNGPEIKTSSTLWISLNSILQEAVSFPTLLAGASETISYTWVPSEPGMFTFTAHITPSKWEAKDSNNKDEKTTIIHTMRILEPTPNQVVEGGLIFVSYENICPQRVGNIDVIINGEQILTGIDITNDVYGQLAVPIFQNGVNTIELVSHYTDGHVNIESVTIISENVVPHVLPSFGDFINYAVSDEYGYVAWEFNFTFQEWISSSEIKVLVIERYGETIYDGWLVVNVFNGYVSDSSGDLWSEKMPFFPFVFLSNPVISTPCQGNIIPFLEWNILFAASNITTWKGYNVIKLECPWAPLGYSMLALPNSGLLTQLTMPLSETEVAYWEIAATNLPLGDNSPPSLDALEDMTFESGSSGNSAAWTITNSDPVSYIVILDGDVVVSGTWIPDDSAVNVNLDHLKPGTYALTIAVKDSMGNLVEDEIEVVVSTPNIPVLESPGDVIYKEGFTGKCITWNFLNSFRGIYTVTKDGVMVVASSDWIPGKNITINIDGLAAGEYTFLLTVRDDYGNVIHDSVSVFVISDSSSSNTSENKNGEIVPISMGIYFVLLIPISIIVLLIFYKRKFKLI